MEKSKQLPRFIKYPWLTTLGYPSFLFLFPKNVQCITLKEFWFTNGFSHGKLKSIFSWETERIFKRFLCWFAWQKRMGKVCKFRQKWFYDGSSLNFNQTGSRNLRTWESPFYLTHLFRMLPYIDDVHFKKVRNLVGLTFIHGCCQDIKVSAKYKEISYRESD